MINKIGCGDVLLSHSKSLAPDISPIQDILSPKISM